MKKKRILIVVKEIDQIEIISPLFSDSRFNNFAFFFITFYRNNKELSQFRQFYKINKLYNVSFLKISDPDIDHDLKLDFTLFNRLLFLSRKFTFSFFYYLKVYNYFKKNINTGDTVILFDKTHFDTNIIKKLSSKLEARCFFMQYTLKLTNKIDQFKQSIEYKKRGYSNLSLGDFRKKIFYNRYFLFNLTNFIINKINSMQVRILDNLLSLGNGFKESKNHNLLFSKYSNDYFKKDSAKSQYIGHILYESLIKNDTFYKSLKQKLRINQNSINLIYVNEYSMKALGFKYNKNQLKNRLISKIDSILKINDNINIYFRPHPRHDSIETYNFLFKKKYIQRVTVINERSLLIYVKLFQNTDYLILNSPSNLGFLALCMGIKIIAGNTESIKASDSLKEWADVWISKDSELKKLLVSKNKSVRLDKERIMELLFGISSSNKVESVNKFYNLIT